MSTSLPSQDAAAREAGTGDFVRELLAFAGSQNWQADHEDVMDVLWLAAHLPGSRFTAAVAEPPVPPDPDPYEPPSPQGDSTETDSKKPGDSREDDDELFEDEDEPEPSIPVFPLDPAKKSDVKSGGIVLLPAPEPFPNRREFIRQWRPLMFRGPSRMTRRVDVQATARRWAHDRIPEIVERPAQERQVELVLVLDHGPSMTVWRSAMRELAGLFRACGGFRRVTVASLKPVDGGVEVVRYDEAASPTAAPVALCTEQAGRDGRSLYLIATDGISPHWWNAQWTAQVDRWARKGTVAMLQVLPERLWPRSALGSAEVLRALAGARLAVNRRYRAVSDFRTTLAVFGRKRAGGQTSAATGALLPAVSLFEPADSRRVIEFLRGAAKSPLTCYRLQPGPVTTAADVVPLRALEAFGQRGSPAARQLATLLACSPAISLPLARIIQKQFLGGEPQRVAEAEVWTSGLLEPMGGVDPAADPEQTLYRFRPEIQNRLLDGSPPGLRQRIIEATSVYIEKGLGRLKGFLAMLSAPGEHRAALDVGPESDPIARVAAEVLRRQGPQYASIVDGHAASRGRRVRDLAPLATHFAYAGSEPCYRFAWSPDGKKLAIPLRDGTLRVWDDDAREESVRQVDRGGLNHVVWFPDDGRLAVACFTRKVSVLTWDLKTSRELAGHNSDVLVVAVGPWLNQPLLVSGTAGGSVRLWDYSTGGLLDLHQESGVGVIRAALWLGGERLVVGYTRKTVVFDCSRSGLDVVKELDVGGTSIARIPPDTADWLPAGVAAVALGQPNGEIQFWRSDTWQKVRSEFPHGSLVTTIDVSHDGRLLASKAYDGSVAVLRVRTGHVVGRLATPSANSPHACVAFRPGTHTLAVAREADREIALYDLSKLRAPPPLRIRIVGSVQGTPEHAEFGRACEEIGRAMAARGDTLVIGSAAERTADYHAFLGYVRARGTGRLRVTLTCPDLGETEYYVDALQRVILEHRWPRGLEALLASTLDAPSVHRLVSALGRRLELQAVARGLRALIESMGEVDTQRLTGLADQILPKNQALRDGLAPIAKDPGGIEFSVQRFGRQAWDALAHTRAFSHFDGMIVVGGAWRTRTVCDFADAFDVPWVPIAAFGGTASEMLRGGSAESGATSPDARGPLAGLTSRREQAALDGSTWTPETAAIAVQAVHRLLRQSRKRTSSLPAVFLGTPSAGQPAAGVAIGPNVILTAAHNLNLRSNPGGGWVVTVRTAPSREYTKTFRVVPAVSWADTANPSDDLALLEGLPERPLEDSAAPQMFEFAGSLEIGQPVHVVARMQQGRVRVIRGVVMTVSEGIAELWLDGEIVPGESGAPVLIRRAGATPLLAAIIRHIQKPNSSSDEPRYGAVLTTWERMLRAFPGVVFPGPRAEPKLAPTAPAAWVLVVGTGWRRLSTVELAAADSLGRALAESEFGLITGGWQGVDHVVARGFVGGLRNRARHPDQWLRHIVPPGRIPDFTEGRAEFVEAETNLFASVERADAVVLIGGSTGAAQAARIATEKRKPLFPLPQTGGEARVAYEAIIKRWPRSVYPGVSKVEFARLERGTLGTPRHAVGMVRAVLHAIKTFGEFLPEREVRQLVEGHASGGPVRETLRLLDTPRQHTWLVATDSRLFCLLDDVATRAANTVIQWVDTFDRIKPLKATDRSNTSGLGLLDFGLRSRWYYSIGLYPRPELLEEAVSQMIRRAGGPSGQPTVA